MHAAFILAAIAGTALAQSQDPNAPCGQQAFGSGPPSNPPTDDGFVHYQPFQFAALTAPTPSGYTAAFRNASGATSQANYLGYYMLNSYNTTACAGYCNAASGCTAFNIYFERDPSLKPADACPNPPPFTYTKCSLWGSNVSNTTATNYGQYQEQFHVVIAGSDGFNHV